MTEKNKCTRAFTALCFFCTMIPAQMAAQQKLFTLEDLNFGGKNYHNLRPQNLFLTWWGDQLMYQDAEEGGRLTDASTKGKDNRKTLFTLKEVGADFHSAMNASYPYPGETLVLLKNSKERVLYDWTKKQTVWRQTCKDEQNSHWNKVSRAVAYTRDNQLYVRTAEGEERQLSADGSREIVYGEAVHRNEFGINEGLFWSPDGQRIAFYRMDQSMVTDYPQVDTEPRIAVVEPDKYPMAGMKSHEVKVGIYDINTRRTVFLSTPLPKEGTEALCYFTNIAWSPDSKNIYMFEVNRDQNDCRLTVYDALTGERLREIYRESHAKYVEPLNPICFLPWDGTKFIMQSQKDGYNHLYVYDVEGRQVCQLTSGPWVVLDVLGFNEKARSVVIASNERHPLQRNLYAVDVKTGQRTLLDNGKGVHRGRLSDTGAMLYDKWTTPDTPNNIDLVKIGKSKCDVQNLLTAPDPWTGENQTGQRECYPTIVYVYGGPHAHNIEASWHWYSRSWETYMAQKGYIVFILDNRGSEHRGRDFEQATFRQLGQIEMTDQMRGVDFLRTLPYVDMDRLGVHGWSFGGFMTISLMLNYPDVFKVGVAGGPVIDWKWYEVMYGERYMDTPEQNPEGYAKTSLLAKAGNLKGKLQVIIGNNDPTVVPQHALSFLKACIEAGTQPDYFVYPGEGHNMMGHSSVHLHERITQYFEDYLK